MALLSCVTRVVAFSFDYTATSAPASPAKPAATAPRPALASSSSSSDESIYSPPLSHQSTSPLPVGGYYDDGYGQDNSGNSPRTLTDSVRAMMIEGRSPPRVAPIDLHATTTASVNASPPELSASADNPARQESRYASNVPRIPTSYPTVFHWVRLTTKYPLVFMVFFSFCLFVKSHFWLTILARIPRHLWCWWTVTWGWQRFFDGRFQRMVGENSHDALGPRLFIDC